MLDEVIEHTIEVDNVVQASIDRQQVMMSRKTHGLS